MPLLAVPVVALVVAFASRSLADVGYSTLDLATVRVFALYGVGTQEVEQKKTAHKYTLAVPLAAHKSFVPLPKALPTIHVRQSVFAVGYPMDPSQKRPQSTRGSSRASRKTAR